MRNRNIIVHLQEQFSANLGKLISLNLRGLFQFNLIATATIGVPLSTSWCQHTTQYFPGGDILVL